MTNISPLFHPIAVGHTPLPQRFTYPFNYTPHPLCVAAAKEVCRYLDSRVELHQEIEQGKMFGVLVVQTSDGQTGFLSAYSGQLAGRNDLPWFVPAVYDMLQPEGHFKKEEEEISAINHTIKHMESAPERLSLIHAKQQALAEEAAAVADYRKEMMKAKERRDALRAKGSLSAEQTEELIRESQHMKATLRRLKKQYKDRVEAIDNKLMTDNEAIECMKTERKQRSDALQQWLFTRFRVVNALGQWSNLNTIFSHTVHRTPPAGAGECCAPKLLQYAYTHDLHPVCMAEFWWGQSPKTELRRHLHYYPACSGKCKPILSHMLKGLEVDPDPATTVGNKKIDIVYEDEWLAVVCKPEGLLSVPGKGDGESVLTLFKAHCPEAEGPVIVHRLDMATSGLMLLAKTKRVHQALQAQFKNHVIRKCYVALLSAALPAASGTISLPLRPDPLDRPRQVVDREHGKPAITRYEILHGDGSNSRVLLYPRTGRTHQLRVHCAHEEGLNTPILGDTLYGRPANRLYLHAMRITFVHPITGEELSFESPAPF